MGAKNENNVRVITGKVRFSYVHVFEPSNINGGDEKYSVSLIIPKTDKKTIADVKAAVEAAKKAGTAKFGGKVPSNLKLPLRDGDTDREDDEAYAGAYFLNASCKTKPGIVDKYGRRIDDPTNFYSGCYGRASVTFYAFNTNGSKGIACGLNNLMKLEDGEALGGRSLAEDDFADFITSEESTEDFGSDEAFDGDEDFDDDFLN